MGGVDRIASPVQRIRVELTENGKRELVELIRVLSVERMIGELELISSGVLT